MQRSLASLMLIVVSGSLLCAWAGSGPPRSGEVPQAETNSSGHKDATAANPGIWGPVKVGPVQALLAPSTPSGTVVDENSAGWGGPSQYWHVVYGYGADGNMVWTYVNGSSVSNFMEWHSGLGAGTYQVYAFVPRNFATTQSAHYRIKSGDSVITVVTVNQNALYDAWESLGTYSFSSEPRVYLGDDTGESYSGTHRMVGFDAVAFSPVGSDPFAQFRSEYNGHYIGDHECVALVKQYVSQVLGIATWYGNAKDYQYNYPRNHFVWIQNTATNYPAYGDIVVWNGRLPGSRGNGHVSVAISADTRKFYSCDQNFPTGSPCHVQYHSYAYVQGWLHFTG